MLVTTMYDTTNPQLNTTLEQFLLALEKDIDFTLPNGDRTVGTLVEVDTLVGTRTLELTIEIDDRFEDMFNPFGDGGTMGCLEDFEPRAEVFYPFRDVYGSTD